MTWHTWHRLGVLVQCRDTQILQLEAEEESQEHGEMTSHPRGCDPPDTWREGRNTCRDPRNSQVGSPWLHCGIRQLASSSQFSPGPRYPSWYYIALTESLSTWLTPEIYLNNSMNIWDSCLLLYLFELIRMNGSMSSSPAKGSAAVSTLVLIQTKVAAG